MNTYEAKALHEAVDAAADAIVTAMTGFNDPLSRACSDMHSHYMHNLLLDYDPEIDLQEFWDLAMS
ncbi:hypothetical protein [Caballeronia sp. LZ001]|uniref:hypothetical protein n=1 Tax=Caballeronia sp. LZ001 TaxID=3038553 RepID=UPI00285A9E32|nr:hypothetical protein [Caballeronia sp. LZ001]MDR5801590.1 hypothetical protein [Caballeronia sp. LZ001]